jgi:hypothetical protein
MFSIAAGNGPNAASYVLASLMLVTIVVCVVQQLVARRVGPLVLRNVEGRAADAIVADFVKSIADSRFGVPSGFFELDRARSRPGDLRFREHVVWRPAVASLWQRKRSTKLKLGAFMMMPLLVYIILFSPFLAIAETFLKSALRSRVRAQLTPRPDDEPGSLVRFQLRGFSALGIRGQLLSALSDPCLPPHVAQVIRGNT